MSNTTFLCTNSWAGRAETPVEIISETQKRYRINLLADALLPSRRRCKQGKVGDVVLVPKSAIKFT